VHATDIKFTPALIHISNTGQKENKCREQE